MYENTDPTIHEITLKLAHVDEIRRTNHKIRGWNVVIVYGPTIEVPEFDYHVVRQRGRKRSATFTPDLAIFRRKTGKLLALARLADPNCSFRSARQIRRYLSFKCPAYVSDGFGPPRKIADLAVAHHRKQDPSIPDPRDRDPLRHNERRHRPKRPR